MNRRVVIAELIKIANTLDQKSMLNEADLVTKIAQDLSMPTYEQFGDPQSIEGPDDHRADMLDIEADHFNNEEALKVELARAEAIDRINEIVLNPNPTEAELQEYQQLLAFLEETDKEKASVQQFSNALTESGADVVDPSDPFRSE
jgi:hypothetical protein